MKNIRKGVTLAVVLVLLTGCNKEALLTEVSGTMTCTKEGLEGGLTKKETMEIIYDEEKVLQARSTQVTEIEENFLDLTLTFGSLYENIFKGVEGIEVEYQKIDDTHIECVTNVDYNKLNLDELKQNLGVEYDENSFYAKKEIDIEEFKNKNLEGYTCT